MDTDETVRSLLAQGYCPECLVHWTGGEVCGSCVNGVVITSHYITKGVETGRFSSAHENIATTPKGPSKPTE